MQKISQFTEDSFRMIVPYSLAQSSDRLKWLESFHLNQVSTHAKIEVHTVNHEKQRFFIEIDKLFLSFRCEGNLSLQGKDITLVEGWIQVQMDYFSLFLVFVPGGLALIIHPLLLLGWVAAILIWGCYTIFFNKKRFRQGIINVLTTEGI